MKNITIGQTDDWKPMSSARYYAQRGEGDEYAFGMTTAEALANLEKREAAVAPKFDIGLAEEVAFLALGASECLREHQDCDLCEFGGYMGFISEVIQHAPLLTDRWQKTQNDFSGVWLYDVTERFGREWAETLLDKKTEDSSEFLEYILADEARKWELCQLQSSMNLR
jgi:hypothetical protein